MPSAASTARPLATPRPALPARKGVQRVPVELLIALEEPGRTLYEAGLGTAGETIGDHRGRLVREPGRAAAKSSKKTVAFSVSP